MIILGTRENQGDNAERELRTDLEVAELNSRYVDSQDSRHT